MRKPSRIRNVQLQYVNQPARRRIKVEMTSGSRIYIIPCCEAWEQYGGYFEELQQTIPIAEEYNNWLHGE